MMNVGDLATSSLSVGFDPLANDDLALTTTKRRRTATIAVRLAGGWIIFLLLVAIFVQWLPIHNYTGIAGNPNVNPGFNREFLGTDDIGRSMLSRMAYGAWISFFISFASTSIAVVIGTMLGLLSIYFRVVMTAISDLIASAILSIPPILLLLTTVLSLGTSFPVLIGAIGIVYIPQFMRLTRNNALSQYSREYIVASRSLGASKWRVIFKELLPNTAPALLSYGMLVLAFVMILEGSLSFLGFGVQPPLPSWGGMISLGAQNLTTSPWQALIPCLVLFLTVYSFNTLGDYFRVRLDVRESKL